MIADRRLAALRRFAVAITALNVAGHTFLGFEQAWAVPLVALATAYGLELLLETIDARLHRNRPRFSGGGRALMDFLLPAHITGLAVSMLLYSGQPAGADRPGHGGRDRLQGDLPRPGGTREASLLQSVESGDHR